MAFMVLNHKIMATIRAPTKPLVLLYRYGPLHRMHPMGTPRPFRRTWASTATRFNTAQTQTQTQQLPVTDKKKNGKWLDLA